MQYLLSVIAILLELFFSSLPFAYAEEVSLDIINAGIRQYDSKIKTVKFDGVVENISNGAKSRTEYTLAYEGNKEFLDIHRWQSSDPKSGKMADSEYTMEYVFDGERGWFINKGLLDASYMVINGRNFEADYDPRFYISRTRNDYDKDTLDKYLRENDAKYIGEEIVELNYDGKIIKEPCYLMSFKDENAGETSNCWISKKAFRLMKYEYIDDQSNKPKFSFSIVYKQFPDDIWYPVSIEYGAGKTTISNIEINTDVSRFFKLDIPLNIRILDFNNGKWYVASEVPDKITPIDPKASTTRSKKQDDSDDMSLIPAGTFKMGDEGKEVNVDAFYMDKYEVTNKEYAEFLNAIGKNEDDKDKYKRPLLYLEHRGDEYWGIKLVGSKYEAEPAYADHPISNVSYHGAIAYAKWKGKKLPTEVEWEKAARGGLVGKEFPWGDAISHDNANYKGTDGMDIWQGTSPVGIFPPNGYGLYDMAGNVSEMCLDLYDLSSPPDDSSFRIVTRGGSWGNDYYCLRCAFRFASYGGEQNIGFRCAKDMGKTTDNK